MKLTRRDAKHSWKDGRRYHSTPFGDLPGITTVLGIGKTADQRWLKKWRESVGEEEANRISKRALERGTRLHELVELYIETGEITEDPLFAQAKQVLDECDDFWVMEHQVYHPMGFAGSLDLLAEYRGNLTLIDWKTATKKKYKSGIKDYYLQIAGYCKALKVSDKIDCNRGLIVVIVEGADSPQLFDINPDQIDSLWREFTDTRLNKYQELYPLEI